MFRPIAITAFIAAITCSGCATAPKEDASQPVAEPEQAQVEPETGPAKPEIDSGRRHYFPRIQYLTSSAKGDTPEQARQQALTSLRNYFIIDTEAFEMSLKQAELSAGYEALPSGADKPPHMVVSPKAHRVLDKIEVGEQWFDKENNTYHALAVMPRNTAKGFLHNEIQRLDEQTREAMKAARSETDPFLKSGKIATAWRCQQIRGKLQESMKHADVTSRGIEPQFKLSLLRKDTANLLSTLRIKPEGVAGEKNARDVAELIKGGLVTQELKPAGDNADYIMRGTLEAAVNGSRNNWALGHGKLQLALLDKASGKVLGSTEWEVDVPGLDENAAIRRVYEKTAYMLKVRIRDVLVEMAMRDSS